MGVPLLPITNVCDQDCRVWLNVPLQTKLALLWTETWAAHSLMSVIFSSYPSILTNEGHISQVTFGLCQKESSCRNIYMKISPPYRFIGSKSHSFSNEKSFAWRFVFIQRHQEEKEMAWYCVVLMELRALQRERKTILLCSGLLLSYLQGACNPLSSNKGSTLQWGIHDGYNFSQTGSVRWLIIDCMLAQYTWYNNNTCHGGRTIGRRDSICNGR